MNPRDEITTAAARLATTSLHVDHQLSTLLSGIVRRHQPSHLNPGRCVCNDPLDSRGLCEDLTDALAVARALNGVTR